MADITVPLYFACLSGLREKKVRVCNTLHGESYAEPGNCIIAGVPPDTKSTDYRIYDIYFQ